jgi:hypothetical protein
MSMRTGKGLLALAFAVGASSISARDFQTGDLSIGRPYARPTAPSQPTGGGYLTLTSKGRADRLLSASTPVAREVQLHSMKMEGDVMRMRAAPQLELPAGQPVELKPGGYHIMMLDLEQPLAAGSSVPMTLVLRNAKGVESRLELKLPVLGQAPAGAAAAPTGGHKH